MANDTKIEYCILNVAANPHPNGVYLKMLKTAALSAQFFQLGKSKTSPYIAN